MKGEVKKGELRRLVRVGEEGSDTEERWAGGLVDKNCGSRVVLMGPRLS